jgi:hypothetical protein
MMRRFVNNLFASGVRRARKGVVAGLAGIALLGLSAEASAQEIQITGPLAGAPAVRKLRLHREGRFEIAPNVSFTLLDEYQRTIMPGLRVAWHPTDYLGFGIWGGFGFQYSTGLTDELQEKAVDRRDCSNRASSKACRLTEVNLTRPGTNLDGDGNETSQRTGQLSDDQLGKMQWVVAPQITLIPFRGKLALFASLFVDTDVNIFVGPAIIGLQERVTCGFDEDKKSDGIPSCSNSFELGGRVTVAPTFGLGLNFYPSQFIGFGAEWRGLPFSWNTSGFDNHGGGNDKEFPDTAINGDDREFRFNSMLTVHVSIQLPTPIKTTE